MVTVSCRLSAGQGKFAGQKPTFYRCAKQPTDIVDRRHISLISETRGMLPKMRHCGLGLSCWLAFCMTLTVAIQLFQQQEDDFVIFSTKADSIQYTELLLYFLFASCYVYVCVLFRTCTDFCAIITLMNKLISNSVIDMYGARKRD